MSKDYKYSADYLFKTRGFDKTEEVCELKDFFTVQYCDGHYILTITEKGISYKAVALDARIDYVPLSLLIPVCAKLREMEEKYSVPYLAQFGTILDTLGLANEDASEADVKDRKTSKRLVNSGKPRGKLFGINISDREDGYFGHTISTVTNEIDKDEYKKLLVQNIEALI